MKTSKRRKKKLQVLGNNGMFRATFPEVDKIAAEKSSIPWGLAYIVPSCFSKLAPFKSHSFETLLYAFIRERFGFNKSQRRDTVHTFLLPRGNRRVRLSESNL